MRFSLLALALAGAAHGASLLAVDYGTDAFKAALVKPGVPFDVLINADSKRKTPAIVALRATERSFGGAAVNLVRRDDDVAMLTLLQATRFPRDTFSAVKLLLGGAATSAQAQLHRSLYPAAGPPATTTRGSPALSSSTTSYAVEEVLAMQLAYAKETAEGVAGEQVREALVTVPSWFGQSERVAVLDAVELAGLRCIGLVNDGTAGLSCFPLSSALTPYSGRQLRHDAHLSPDAVVPPHVRLWRRLSADDPRFAQVCAPARPSVPRRQADPAERDLPRRPRRRLRHERRRFRL